MPYLSEEEYSVYSFTMENNIQLKEELENEKKRHDETKNKLQEQMLKNKQLVKELGELKKKLKGKMDLIHSFANNFSDVGNRKKHNMKRIVKLSNNFEKIMLVCNITQADIGSVMLRLQDISQVCNNCREEKKKIEEKCALLNDSNMNIKFVNEQLTHKVHNLTLENNSLKIEAQIPKKNKLKKDSSLNMLPLTPDSVSTEDSHISTFSDLSVERSPKETVFSRSPNILRCTSPTKSTEKSFPLEEVSTVIKNNEKIDLKPNENHKKVNQKPTVLQIEKHIYNEKKNVKCKREVVDDLNKTNSELRVDKDKSKCSKSDIKCEEDSKSVKNNNYFMNLVSMQENISSTNAHVLIPVEDEVIIDEEIRMSRTEESIQNGIFKNKSEGHKTLTDFKNHDQRKSIFSPCISTSNNEDNFFENEVLKSNIISQEDCTVVKTNNNILVNFGAMEEDLSVSEDRKTYAFKLGGDEAIKDKKINIQPTEILIKKDVKLENEILVRNSGEKKTLTEHTNQNTSGKSIFSPCLNTSNGEGKFSENELKSNIKSKEDCMTVKNDDNLVESITEHLPVCENNKTCVFKTVGDETITDKEIKICPNNKSIISDFKTENKIFIGKNEKNKFSLDFGNNSGEVSNNLITSSITSPNLDDFDAVCRFMHCHDLIEPFDSIVTFANMESVIMKKPFVKKDDQKLEDSNGQDSSLISVSHNLRSPLENNSVKKAAKYISNNSLKCIDFNTFKTHSEHEREDQEIVQNPNLLNISQNINNQTVKDTNEQPLNDDNEISAIANLSVNSLGNIESISVKVDEIEHSSLVQHLENKEGIILPVHDEAAIDYGKSEKIPVEVEKIENLHLDLSVENTKLIITPKHDEAVIEHGKFEEMSVEVKEIENLPLDLTVNNTKISKIDERDEAVLQSEAMSIEVESNSLLDLTVGNTIISKTPENDEAVNLSMETRDATGILLDNGIIELKMHSPKGFNNYISSSIKHKPKEGVPLCNSDSSLKVLETQGSSCIKNSLNSENISYDKTHQLYSSNRPILDQNKQDTSLQSSNLVTSQNLFQDYAKRCSPSLRNMGSQSPKRSPDALKYYTSKNVQIPNYSEKRVSKRSPLSNLSPSKDTPCLNINTLKLPKDKKPKKQCPVKRSQKFTTELTPTTDQISPKRHKERISLESLHKNTQNKSIKRLSPTTKAKDISNNSQRSPEGLKNYNLRLNCSEKPLCKNILATYSLFASREERGLPPIVEPEKIKSLPFDQSLFITIPSEDDINCSDLIAYTDRLLMKCKLQELCFENSNLHSDKHEVHSKLSPPICNLVVQQKLVSISQKGYPDPNNIEIINKSTGSTDEQINLLMQQSQFATTSSQVGQEVYSQELNKMDIDEHSSKPSHANNNLEVQQHLENNDKLFSQDFDQVMKNHKILSDNFADKTPLLTSNEDNIINKTSLSLIGNIQTSDCYSELNSKADDVSLDLNKMQITNKFSRLSESSSDHQINSLMQHNQSEAVCCEGEVFPQDLGKIDAKENSSKLSQLKDNLDILQTLDINDKICSQDFEQVMNTQKICSNALSQKTSLQSKGKQNVNKEPSHSLNGNLQTSKSYSTLKSGTDIALGLNKMDITNESSRSSSDLRKNVLMHQDETEAAFCEEVVSQELDKKDVDKSSSKAHESKNNLEIQDLANNHQICYKNYSRISKTDKISSIKLAQEISKQIKVKKYINNKSTISLVGNIQTSNSVVNSTVLDTKAIDLDKLKFNLKNSTFNKNSIFDEGDNPHFGIIKYTTPYFIKSDQICTKHSINEQSNCAKNSSNRVDVRVEQNITEVNQPTESLKRFYDDKNCSHHKNYKEGPDKTVSQQKRNIKKAQIDTLKAIKKDTSNISDKSQVLCKVLKKLCRPTSTINEERKPPNTYSRLKLDRKHKFSANKNNLSVTSTSNQKCFKPPIQSKFQSTSEETESINPLVIEKENLSSEITQPISGISRISHDEEFCVKDTDLLKIKKDSNVPATSRSQLLSSHYYTRTSLNRVEHIVKSKTKDSSLRPSKCNLANPVEELRSAHHKVNNLTECKKYSKSVCDSVPSSDKNKLDRIIKYGPRNHSELTMIPLGKIKNQTTGDKQSFKETLISSGTKISKEAGNPVSKEFLTKKNPSTSKFLSEKEDLNNSPHDVLDTVTVLPAASSLNNSSLQFSSNVTQVNVSINSKNQTLQNLTEIKTQKSEIECESSVTTLDCCRLSEPENLIQEEHQPSKKMKFCDYKLDSIPIDHRAYTVRMNYKQVNKPDEPLSDISITPIPSNKDRPTYESSSEDEENNLVMDVEDCSLNGVCELSISPAGFREVSTENISFSPSKAVSYIAVIPSSGNSKSSIECDTAITIPKPMLPAQHNSLEVQKTDVDLSHSVNIIPHFYGCNQSIESDSNQQLCRSPSISEDPANKSQSLTDEYFPNFYTEWELSNEKNVEEPLTETETTKTKNEDFLGHLIYKQKTLEDLIPKGNKLSIQGNIIQSIMRNHSNNLCDYIGRNVTEKRKIRSHNIQDSHVELVSEVLKPFISNGVDNLMELVKTADRLLEYDCRTILKGLISTLNEIAKSVYDPKNKNEANMWIKKLDCEPVHNDRIQPPAVNPRVQAFVTLFVIINDKKVKTPPKISEFFKDALQYLEDLFFCEVGSNQCLMDVTPFLLFTYACLARLSGSLLRARQLLYDSFYCLTKGAYTNAYILIRTWPAILRVQSYYSDPLALVILNAVSRTYSTPINTSGFNSYSVNGYYMHKLSVFMHQKHKIPAAAVSPDKFIEVFINRLSQQDVDKAMILLAKRMGEEWFLKSFLHQLMSVVVRWRKGEVEDREAASAINILCCICRSLNPVSSQLATQPLFELFKELLFSENTPSWMQEIVAITVSRLSRLNFSICIEILLKWKPSEISSEVADQILLNIIGRRCPKWWLNKKGGMHYLTTK